MSEKNIIGEILSNHFDNLSKSASVSIGLYAEGDYRATDIRRVVSVLRENGIDAVLATSEEAKDLSKFIVDETGIRTPLFFPEDAKKATIDIIKALDENNIGIMGYALPQTKDNLTYSSFTTVDKGLREMQVAEKEFVSSQLSKIADMPAVTSFAPNSIYRGGTLGNNPYAVITAFAHARDCAFGSESVEIARLFTGANRDAWAGRIHYPEVDGKAYGFLYEYEKAPDQLFYDNYGIENRKVSSSGVFETPIFEHRNKLKAVYLECDGKIVQIAGANGKYISPEWEHFAELHNPSALNTSMERIARNNAIKVAAERGEAISYVKRDPQILAQEEAMVTAVKKQAAQAESGVSSATKSATASALRQQAAGSQARVRAVKKTTAAQTARKTLQSLNQAYDNTFDAIMKWGDKHAPQWMNRLEEATVQKAAKDFMKTKTGQAMAKQIEKKVGKELAASIAKKIPVLCLAVGAACVYDRLKEGEYLKALGEGASSVAAMVPGAGTLVSMGLDSAIIMDDLKIFGHGVIKADPNRHMTAESTGVQKPMIVDVPRQKSSSLAERLARCRR